MIHRHGHRQSPGAKDEEVILVSIKGDDPNGADTKYETLFLKSTDEGAEYELVFFRRLDHEFNKVVKFYKEKVEQVMKEADELSRQMNTLIALRIKVERTEVDGRGIGSMSWHDASTTFPSSFTRPQVEKMSVIEEASEHGEEEEETKSKEDTENQVNESENRLAKYRPAPLEILQHVKINVESETPISTIKGMLRSTSTNCSFSRTELKTAQDKMTHAFISFHHELRLLKSYW